MSDDKLIGYIATFIGVCRPSAGRNVCFCKDHRHEITKQLDLIPDMCYNIPCNVTIFDAIWSVGPLGHYMKNEAVT